MVVNYVPISVLVRVYSIVLGYDGVIAHKWRVPAGACLSLLKDFTSQDCLCLHIVKLKVCVPVSIFVSS